MRKMYAAALIPAAAIVAIGLTVDADPEGSIGIERVAYLKASDNRVMVYAGGDLAPTAAAERLAGAMNTPGRLTAAYYFPSRGDAPSGFAASDYLAATAEVEDDYPAWTCRVVTSPQGEQSRAGDCDG